MGEDWPGCPTTPQRSEPRTGKQADVEFGGHSSTLPPGPTILERKSDNHEVNTTSPDDGFYVKATILKRNVPMLLDTGASVSILSNKFIDSCTEANKFVIKPIRRSLVTATGEIQPFIGITNLSITIGSRTFEHEFLVASIQNDGILGVDFLTSHGCDLLITQGILQIGSENIPCFSDHDLSYRASCRVVVKETTVVPPQTEIMLQGVIIDKLKSCGPKVLETSAKFTENSGLLVARSLVNVDSQSVPLQMVNFHDEPFKVHKGTVVAYCEDILDITTTPVNHIIAEDRSSENNIPSHMTELYSQGCEHLNSDQCQSLKKLLCEHSNLFSKHSGDIGHTNLVEHEIDTGDTRPFKQQPYRIPLAKRLHAEAEIQKMADEGIIEPSTSPWCSPIVMASKKDGSIRFCLDFRKLNSFTLKDSKPLPRIDDTLDALSGSEWFSTMDLKSGFWQVGLSEKDRPKTAFSTFGGALWQFTVMPFGLCNAPATFERLMERVLSGLSWVKCLVFLDDIIVFSKTFDEHIQNLKEIFIRLKEANLKLSPKKCTLLQHEVSFLGHIVSNHGVSTDPHKTKAISEWPIPRNVKDVRSFIGICSYYRRFVKDFAKVAKPLHQLTETNKQFVWTDECQSAFDELKLLLTTTPILSYPKEHGLFILDTDASGTGLGAVLSQVQNGEEKVISYYSKCFSKSERNYCVTRRELLAVVSAVKQYHHYLYGCNFLVRSDHGALRWLMNFKQPGGQLARWLETLSMYDFNIEHRQGRVHSNADGLSRRPCYSHDCKHCENSEKQVL